MNNYPKVNYIGNKEKLAEWIIQKLPIEKGTVLDLFCGGCSVSYALKEQGFNVISNDALFSNYVIAKAIIENNNELLSKEDINVDISKENQELKYKELEFLINNLYFAEEVSELANLISISEQLDGYKKYLFLSLLRRSMIRKIPYSRMNIKWDEIKKLRDEDYSYKKYGRYRHYHNISFLEHILENLQDYNKAVINTKATCIATNYDALDCLKNLTQPVDVVYMDPPYPSTMNKYDEFYGSFDVAMSREVEIKTDLTNKNTFLENFTEIIKLCVGKTKYIAISLNNKSFPSAELLLKHISNFIDEYTLSAKEHVYKVTGKENKKTNIEILLICKMKELL
ncbi:MAG: DNA methyltransferase [Ruminococcaceae bacterium]|nr:DNA methyltransferase [Oscillospiraceae bacterium]